MPQSDRRKVEDILLIIKQDEELRSLFLEIMINELRYGFMKSRDLWEIIKEEMNDEMRSL